MLARLAILFIRLYQLIVSPYTYGNCRFTPTCSHYGLESFQKHGFWRGLILTTRRLFRCRPGGPRGYDPVPDKD